MLYVVIKVILGVVAHLLFRVTTRGASNVPAEGPVVLCANHIAWWDPILVAFALKRPVHFMAKKELFRYPVLSYLFRKAHAFPVNRGKPDIGAVKTALTVLNEGHVLGIFPEGTRQKDREHLGEMHAGAALFALKTGAPVVPAAIRGTYRIGKPVVLVFGERFTLEPSTGRTSTDMQEGARAIEGAISRLWDSIREETQVTAREVGSC
ncbi:MAG: lysophospholipid acyltransferase family protein [Bacillota bacterium]|nr:1-acyl-sn-glycerol-3-phosphate acyltransferase [Candidatus Fermentithermobacillaceae bacterium]